jgi:hypothetical protein
MEARMTVLQNPVIPIVVRWSAREASLRVENRRPAESIRPDRLAQTERACAVLDGHLPPILRPLLHETMTDQRARGLVARIQHAADLVTEETEVLFVVALETDADRDAQDRDVTIAQMRSQR